MSRWAALRARSSAFGYSLCCLKIFSDVPVLSRCLFRQIACEYRNPGCTQKTWTQPTIFDSLNVSGVSYKMYSNSSDVSPLRNPVLACDFLVDSDSLLVLPGALRRRGWHRGRRPAQGGPLRAG